MRQNRNHRQPLTAPGRHAARGAARPQPLPQALLEAIETDPVFQVMTDDFRWLDPFTGDAVPAHGGRVETAREHLQTTGAWHYANPLTRPELDIIRWRLDLIPRLREEPRLRLFTRDGLWVNPYTAELVSGIRREDGKITTNTVLDLARVLAVCAPASTGLLLDITTLQSRIRNQARDDSGARACVPEPTARVQLLVDPLQRARDVQPRRLASLPYIDGYETAVHYAPCASVGGDFYECIELSSGRRTFLLGEVSSHGVEAARVVASALSTLRLLARGATSSLELLTRFNDEARRDLVPGQFITLFTAELDPLSRSLICLCAGHHPALLFCPTSDTLLRRVGNQGMAVGLTDSDTFRSSLAPMTIDLRPGDMLLQYTEGVTEVQNHSGEPFGEMRLCAAAFTLLEHSAQAFVDGVVDASATFAGGPMNDDVTAFALLCLLDPTDTVSTDAWVWPLPES